MKLSRLYSNSPELFAPVDFTPGLNVVLAEIRLPENRDKDTHNLGKTTLGRVLDFGFLAGRDPKFFLFKHFNLFKDFVFFLEIELADASYVTVRRGVQEATKISFKKHEASYQDFSTLPPSEWDHLEMPFDRAREMLDSLLDWRALKPWHYRKGLGYLLRSQDDYRDVFQLSRFVCIAFDMALLRAHLDERFPRFVYHDGVFESLDDRKKENLLVAIRRYDGLGIQTTITLIDSDLPARDGQIGSVFEAGEIIMTLHDEDDQGRLFKMKAW